nr:hypothetical protein [Tanacetum cinerariifolium]
IIDGKLRGGTEDFSSVSGNNALRRTLDQVCMDIRCFSVVEDILFIPRHGSMNSNRCRGNALSNGTTIITIQGNLVEVKAIFKDQLTILSPRNYALPDVLLLVSGQPA